MGLGVGGGKQQTIEPGDPQESFSEGLPRLSPVWHACESGLQMPPASLHSFIPDPVQVPLVQVPPEPQSEFVVQG